MSSPSVNGDLQNSDDNEPLLSHLNTNHPRDSSGDLQNKLSDNLKVQCPTCQGKGKLSQSQADTMVALIPVRDKRLKPRKTKLYLGLTVVISVICIFLIAFFLLPRTVSINIVATKAVKIYILDDKESVPYIDVELTFALKNKNFFDAKVESVSVDVSWSKFILNNTITSKPFTVSGRSTRHYTFIARQVFEGKDVMRKVKTICCSGWNWLLLEKFVSTASVSYLARVEEISDIHYGYTKCHSRCL